MQNPRNQHLGIAIIAIAAFLLVTSVNTLAQKLERREYINATAMGTSTQLGRVISVQIILEELSTPEDRTVLLQVFQEKGAQGLYNALDKMKAKGRIAITGTLGFDVNYARSFDMPDGSRKIRFVTDRPISFGELWTSSRSMDYSLSMGEVIISKDKSKSSGTLCPAAMFKIDKDNELSIETYQNPWKLVNISVDN